MTDIDPLAQRAYSLGRDPIEWAVFLAKTQIALRELICATRRGEPGAFPGYMLDLDEESAARRIIGDLLDAGWTPPQDAS